MLLVFLWLLLLMLLIMLLVYILMMCSIINVVVVVDVIVVVALLMLKLLLQILLLLFMLFHSNLNCRYCCYKHCGFWNVVGSFYFFTFYSGLSLGSDFVKKLHVCVWGVCVCECVWFFSPRIYCLKVWCIFASSINLTPTLGAVNLDQLMILS